MDKAFRVELKRPRSGGEKISMIIGARLRREVSGTEEGNMPVLVKLPDEEWRLGRPNLSDVAGEVGEAKT